MQIAAQSLFAFFFASQTASSYALVAARLENHHMTHEACYNFFLVGAPRIVLTGVGPVYLFLIVFKKAHRFG